MIKMTPQYNTILFCDVWDSPESFMTSFLSSPLHDSTDVEEKSIPVIFALLSARYGNSPIANEDVNQFENKIFSIIFQYGPSWEKRLDIQKKLRHISEEDLLKGGKAIYNNALNPDGGPATQSLEELPRINSQSTTNYKKSKMDAYTQLWDLIEVDVSNEFINKFSTCFKKFVRPEKTLLYYDYEGEE